MGSSLGTFQRATHRGFLFMKMDRKKREHSTEDASASVPMKTCFMEIEGYQKKPIRGIIFRDNDGQKRPDFLIGCVALGVVSPENSHGCYVSGTCCSGVFVS